MKKSSLRLDGGHKLGGFLPSVSIDLTK